MFNPKQYLENPLIYKCNHPAITIDLFDLIDNHDQYTRCHCLICGRNLININNSNSYVFKINRFSSFDETLIIKRYIRAIFTKYANEESIDLVSILNNLKPNIETSILELRDIINNYPIKTLNKKLDI